MWTTSLCPSCKGHGLNAVEAKHDRGSLDKGMVIIGLIMRGSKIYKIKAREPAQQGGGYIYII